MLASCGRDKTVKLWDLATGRLMRTLDGHTEVLLCVDFSPDGRLLASSGGSVKLWDTRNWREIRTLPGRHVVFSPDGCRLSSSGPDGLRIWNTAALARETGAVDPARIVKGSFGRSRFSPDSRLIAALAKDRVEILEVTTGQRTLPPLGPVVGRGDVTFSPDGRYLACSAHDPTVKVWDTRAGRLLRTFRGHTDLTVGVDFSPDGRQVASTSLDGTVKVWDASNLEEDGPREALTLTVRSGSIVDVAYRPVGGSFATLIGRIREPGSVGSVEAVTFWDARTAREIRTLPRPSGIDCHDVVLSPAFDRMAWAGSDGTVEVLSVPENQPIHTLRGHSKPVWRVAYSPNGRRIASASMDVTVWVWDAETGMLIRGLPGFSDVIGCLRFSPDGKRLALCGETLNQLHPGEVRIWDAETGRQLPTLGDDFTGSWCVAFHPFEQQLAHSVISEIFILDRSSGRRALTLRGHTVGEINLAYSPDGRRLASAAGDGTVRLWEAATGREILKLLHGRDDAVTGVCFSPDGRQIVSVSKRGIIKVWDATPLTEPFARARPSRPN
jgi:WD40 repeat protein